MVTVRYLVVVLLVLCGSAASAAPRPTSTATAVFTAVPAEATYTPALTSTPSPAASPTVTGSPKARARIKPEVIEWPTAQPTNILATRTPKCVMVLRADNTELECIPSGVGGGGGCTELNGATRCPDAWSDDVSTDDTETYVETTEVLPKGAIVDRCFARTQATVATSSGNSVEIGLAGAEQLWGTLGGTVGNTNTDDTTWPSRRAIYTDTNVRVTVKGGGTFSNNTGVVRVICFYLGLEGIP